MNTTQSLIQQRIEGVASPRDATEQTLRGCWSELDAIKTSVVLSHLTVREIAARMGVGKSLVNAYTKEKADGGRALTLKRTQAFCNATGTNLVKQFREMERARRIAAGNAPERDRIAAIAAPTQHAWSQSRHHFVERRSAVA